MVTLYGELARREPSPIVELNRAVAISMASAGPHSSWSTSSSGHGTLDRYHLLHSVRGDLLDKLGRQPRRPRSSSAPAPGDEYVGTGRIRAASPAPAAPAQIEGAIDAQAAADV